MTEDIKSILAKPADQVTDEERSKLEESKTEYAKEVAEVCHKHGWQHVPFLEVTASGILPRLAIVPLPETPKAPEVVDAPAV